MECCRHLSMCFFKGGLAASVRFHELKNSLMVGIPRVEATPAGDTDGNPASTRCCMGGSLGVLTPSAGQEEDEGGGSSSRSHQSC